MSMTTIRRRLLGLGLLVVVIIGLQFIPGGRAVIWPLTYVARPIEKSVWQITNQIRAQLLVKLGGPEAGRLAELESAFTSLGVERAQLSALEEENKKLKELLVLKNNQAWRSVAAAVVGQDPRDVNGLIRVGAGGRDGLVRGAAVTNSAGVFVGVVVEVGENISVVRLARSRGISLIGQVTNRPDAVGLVESPDGLSLRFSQVPKDNKLALGDVVVTSLGLVGIPAGIPVGAVARVNDKPEDLWQEAILTPFAKLSDLTFVNIVIPAVDSEPAL
jgi:rod shape-determining protein MreC